MKCKLLLCFICILFSTAGFMAHAQNKVTIIKGKITGKDGVPLPGVSVMLKGKPVEGVVTDAEGNYTLRVKETSGTIVFTSVGYSLKEIPFNETTGVIDVKLEETVSVLNDVILTGYIKQKKSDITGAISSVRNKDFKDQPVSNLAQSIQGKVSGVLVSQPSGTPGAGLAVSIRGTDDPLYVIDGVPMISESNSSLSTSYNTDGEEVGKGQNISSVSDINPDDIESIEILKDASSASIYGARAANGVVLITTKRGKNGKTEFNFNSFTGVQNVARKIPFLDSRGFISLIEDARTQDYKLYQQDPSLFGDGFDPAILTNPLPESWNTGVNTNWLDEIFRPAPISNIQLSARGGNDKTKFFMAGNYFDQQGIVIENFYKRGSFRLNVDNKVSDRVTIGANASFTYSRNRRSFNDDTYTGYCYQRHRCISAGTCL
ncbi:MAG: TonB-dependent receptor plug domain-containing protein [Chitinophagaceae bacterium]